MMRGQLRPGRRVTMQGGTDGLTVFLQNGASLVVRPGDGLFVSPDQVSQYEVEPKRCRCEHGVETGPQGGHLAAVYHPLCHHSELWRTTRPVGHLSVVLGRIPLGDGASRVRAFV